MRRLLPPLLAIATPLFVIFIVVFTQQNLAEVTDLRNTTASVEHTLDVDRALDAVLLEVTQAESGQRGFLLTGEDTYLPAYAGARDRLSAALAALSKLTQSDPEQQERTKRLEKAAMARMGELALTLDKRDTEGVAAAQEMVRNNMGYRKMEEMRAIAGEIVNAEGTELSAAKADAEYAFARAQRGRIASAVVSTILLMALAALFGTQLSKRDRASAELSREREYLSVTLSSIGDAVIATDVAGRITLMNAVASQLTGWRPEEALGRNIHEVFVLINASTKARIAQPLERVLRGGKSIDLDRETLLVSRDGQSHPVDDSGAAIRGSEGEVMGMVLVFRDVTERRRQDVALRESEQRFREAAEREHQARSDAEQANRLKDEFLAVLSHELRTPLNAVLGWAQILRNGVTQEATMARALSSIQRNAEAQQRLVEDLLDVSRIVARKFAVDRRPIEIRGAINVAADAVRPAAVARNVDLIVNLSGPVVVEADPHRIQQVTSNLLSNAVKFTPTGGRVELTLSAEGSSAVLTVRDSGQGISADVLPHIFDRFRQGDGSFTRAHGGLGLGLAIVKHIVDAHGGTITANSTGEGKGATFVVRLPLADTRVAPKPSSDTHTIVGPFAKPLAGLRTLVVDDEADSRDLLAYALTEAGCEVVVADSGEDALAAIARGCPHLLLADIQMPDMDGFALLAEVRRRLEHATPHAIAITARAAVDDAAKAAQAGFAAHVTKPFRLRELVETIEQVVGRRTV